MKHRGSRVFLALGLTFAAATHPAAAQVVASAPAILEPSDFRLDFLPQVEHDGATLTLAGPDHFYLRQTFAAADAISIPAEMDGASLPDGQYAWEITFSPKLSTHTRRALAEARASGDGTALAELRRNGALPSSPMVAAGFFRVREGAFMAGDATEAPSAAAGTRSGVVRQALPDQALPGVVRVAAADQVIPDDLIVQASLCVGFDCVNGENFGADTIRMKENNTRIDFTDTSTQAGFPSQDWEIAANDSGSGGRNALIVKDENTDLLVVESGNAANALYVASSGDVGLGTSTPALDLHISRSDTPTLRLEQNNSGGFTAQTWDVAGNEANFFVRDVTGGSLLSFRVRPGAPTSSIDISADGDVGVGTGSPAARLHVHTTSTTAPADGQLLVRNASTSGAAQRVLIVAENFGAPQTELRNSSSGISWRFGMNDQDNFVINDLGDPAVAEFRVNPNGDVFVNGALVHSSSRSLKELLASVEPTEILRRLSGVPISRWTYLTDSAKTPHMGPMAEDFYGAFALGADDKHIALNDAIGVALASVQGLLELVEQKEAQVEELSARMARLEAMLGSGTPPSGPESPGLRSRP